ncbi:viral IAP-associated factor [Chytridium lagenaria]|nr:viral IAP-associated factor [Chytridium lagenaria]
MSHLEDTEWNDALRARGIIPPKEAEITEEAIEQMMDQVIKQKYGEKELEDRTLDELDELEDEEDDRVLEEYKRKRMQEMKALASKEIYGTVTQISKPDYTVEVTEASKSVYVVVFLFQAPLPACRLIGAHLDTLARKHRSTKFVKLVADQCIPNYPDRNCPTLIIYGEGDLKANLVGIETMGGQNVTAKGLERILAAHGAVELREEDVKEVLEEYVSSIRVSRPSKNNDDDDDWE